MSDSTPPIDRFRKATERAVGGGPERHHEKLIAQGKLFVRARVELLCDPGSFVEDGLLANSMEDGLAADAVVTGRGTVDGRPIVVIANDATVKAGSWGRLTVEKMIRALEAAYDELLPVFYLVGLCGGSHHGSGRPVPWAARCRQDLLQPGAPLRKGSPGVLPIRTVRRRRRLHPFVLRRGGDGRGEGLDVPRVSPNG